VSWWRTEATTARVIACSARARPAAGFHAKQDVSHQLYERLRNPMTSKRELRELHLFQQEVFSWIPVPDNATDIPDYEEEGF
jgi:hypothetical protein